jgi:hypothetical protein
MPMGERGAGGVFPEGTVGSLIDKQLTAMAEKIKAAGGEEKKTED